MSIPTSETPIDQKRAIIQNKPNLPNAQMNVNKVLTKDYENDNAFRPHENKPNQTQFQNQPRRPDKSGGLIIDVADGDAYNTTIHL